MDVACLVSGGKDSLYALFLAYREGHDIKSIITMIPESDESYMFHYPNVEFVSLQAECLGIPHLKKKTLARKEEELADLESALQNLPVSGIVSGAIASSYQKERIDVLCERLGFESLSPLWKKKPEEILEALSSEKFEIIITGVAADGLGREFLGRHLFDAKDELEALSRRHGIHLLGEGGEYETFVCDMPLFKKRIVVQESEIIWEGKAGKFLIKKAATASKDF